MRCQYQEICKIYRDFRVECPKDERQCDYSIVFSDRMSVEDLVDEKDKQENGR